MRVCSCSNHGIVFTVSSSAEGGVAWGRVCGCSEHNKDPRSTYARVHCKYAWEKIRQPFFFGGGGATSFLLPSHISQSYDQGSIFRGCSNKTFFSRSRKAVKQSRVNPNPIVCAGRARPFRKVSFASVQRRLPRSDNTILTVSQTPCLAGNKVEKKDLKGKKLYNK